MPWPSSMLTFIRASSCAVITDVPGPAMMVFLDLAPKAKNTFQRVELKKQDQTQLMSSFRLLPRISGMPVVPEAAYVER